MFNDAYMHVYPNGTYVLGGLRDGHDFKTTRKWGSINDLTDQMEKILQVTGHWPKVQFKAETRIDCAPMWKIPSGKLERALENFKGNYDWDLYLEGPHFKG